MIKQLRNGDLKRLRYENKTLTSSFVILMLGKTPNVDKKSFVLVLNEF